MLLDIRCTGLPGRLCWVVLYYPTVWVPCISRRISQILYDTVLYSTWVAWKRIWYWFPIKNGGTRSQNMCLPHTRSQSVLLQRRGTSDHKLIQHKKKNADGPQIGWPDRPLQALVLYFAWQNCLGDRPAPCMIIIRRCEECYVLYPMYHIIQDLRTSCSIRNCNCGTWIRLYKVV